MEHVDVFKLHQTKRIYKAYYSPATAKRIYEPGPDGCLDIRKYALLYPLLRHLAIWTTAEINFISSVGVVDFCSVGGAHERKTPQQLLGPAADTTSAGYLMRYL